MWRGMVLALAVLGATDAPAQEVRTVAGHVVEVTTDGMGTAALAVDGTVLLEDGVIFLDPEPLTVAGVPVVTGVAGAGGNACGAAPFVLALADGATPKVYGPIETCREIVMQIGAEVLIFSDEPLPSQPGNIWIWTAEGGFTEPTPVEFEGQPSHWSMLPDLAGAHPVEAMKMGHVLKALQTGLGADYPVFAERISELGSGDLVPGGYLGRACLKVTCDADWAVLYLDAATEQVFAIWHVYGEVENRIWPPDTTQWPEAAMAVLQAEAGE